MKSQLIAIVAAVLVVGCGESQQSAPALETPPAEPVAEAAKPEPPTTKAPDISIHEAALVGAIEAVKQHLAAGTDVNAKDDYGRTPLHRAAHPNLRIGAFAGKKDVSTQKEIIALLIAEGADVNAKNEDGSTPLYLPAGSGHKEIAELLISKGADVNAKNNWGATPLLLAAIKGHKEIVQLLITKFTDVNAKVALGPKQGSTSLDAADEFNHPGIADILRKHGGKTGEELKAEGK